MGEKASGSWKSEYLKELRALRGLYFDCKTSQFTYTAIFFLQQLVCKVFFPPGVLMRILAMWVVDGVLDHNQ